MSRKTIKTIAKLKLTIMLILSVIVLTIVGIVFNVTGKATGKYGWKHPFLVSALLGEAENVPEPATRSVSTVPVAKTFATVTDASAGDATETDADEEEDGTSEFSTIAERCERPMRYKKLAEFTPRSAYYEYTGKKAITTDYPYVQADEHYFEDALFIGDSRIEGLYDFGGLEGADFCYKQGITSFTIMQEVLQRGDNYPGNLRETLEEKEYKKVYIMLGINELGKGFCYEYAEQMNQLIQYVHEYQDNAVVIVLGIMYVTDEYSQAEDVYNNDNINARNSLVAQYIDGRDTMYLDVNPAVQVKNTDKKTGKTTGYSLNPEYTNDGIHLTAEHYGILVDYLRSHALQDVIWENQTASPGEP